MARTITFQQAINVVGGPGTAAEPLGDAELNVRRLPGRLACRRGTGHRLARLRGAELAVGDGVAEVETEQINGALADARFGSFGRIWTWISSICAEWPGHDADRYLGPWDRATANPVLVVGNRWDPATRYEGAVTVHHLLPRSALLAVEAWAHTSLFQSSCATETIARHLLTIATPRAGAVCEADVVPFAG